MVSTTTKDVVYQAMEAVRTKDVLDWRNTTLGKSIQAKRRETLGTFKKSEQNWNQLEVRG